MSGSDAESRTGQVVTAFLLAAPEARASVAPDFVRTVGPETVERLLASLWRRIGPLSSVVGGGEQLTLVGSHGTVRVWARADGDVLSALMVERPRGRLAARLDDAGAARVLPGVVVLAAVFVFFTLRCWRAGSQASWLGNLATVAVVLLLLFGFSLPDRLLFSRRVRRGVGVVALAAASSVLRARTLRGGDWGGAALDVAVVALAVGLLLWARRDWPAQTVAAEMVFPLPEGTWNIAVGGGRGPLNHHAAVPQQRGALDIQRIGANGARANGWFPSDVRAYAAYGAPIAAPCAGRVIQATDSFGDQVPFHPWPGPAAGNHVRLDTGTEEVLLAHMRPGSVRVAAGDIVEPGQIVGEVGNSGHSTEPHLHIHAERDGVGLRLRFTGVRHLWRGSTVRAQGHHPESSRR